MQNAELSELGTGVTNKVKVALKYLERVGILGYICNYEDSGTHICPG